MKLLWSLPSNIICNYILFEFLTLQEVCFFDTAVVNKQLRRFLLECFSSVANIIKNVDIVIDRQLKWLILRKLRVSSIYLSKDFNENGYATVFFKYASEMLKKCDLSSCNQYFITDYFFESLCKNCSLLIELDVSCIRRVDDETITGIASCCTRLENISLSLTNIGNVGISSLASNCHQLIELNLSECNITDSSLHCLSRGCPSIRSLNLSGLQGFSEQGWGLLGCGFSSLTALDASRSNLAGESMKQLCAGQPKLLSLKLQSVHNFTVEDISHITMGMTSLTSLDLLGNEALTDDGLWRLLSSCSLLKSLVLYACNSITGCCPGLDTPLGRTYKLPLSMLESLELPTSVTFDGVLCIADTCKNLRSIVFYGTNLNITDSCIENLSSGCPLLSSITLSGCPMVSDGGIAALSCLCNKLSFLSLEGCSNVTDTACEYLARKCHSLVSLNIIGTKISDTGLNVLGPVCKRLRHLKYKGSRITVAGISALPKTCAAVRPYECMYDDDDDYYGYSHNEIDYSGRDVEENDYFNDELDDNENGYGGFED